MSILDTAKELLKKGILLGDAELIEMANKLIQAELDKQPDISYKINDENGFTENIIGDHLSNVVPPKTKKSVTKKPTTKKASTSTTKKSSSAPLDKSKKSDTIDSGEEFSTKKRVHTNGPVKWVENTWEDMGEQGDLDKKELKTPNIKPAVRRPKYVKVTHKCGKCMKQVQVYPHDKTEFYRCDDCLNSMVGR
mgnify:CR=1 FL=1